MNPEFLDLDHIEAYLDNKLTANEKQAFEEELQRNLALQQEVQEVALMIRGIRYTAHKRRQVTQYLVSVRQEMGDSDTSVVTPTAKVRSIFPVRALIGAIAASVSVVLAVVFFMGRGPSSEELLAEYHKSPYPVLDSESIVSRGATKDAQTKRQEAFIAYASGEYDEAIKLFVDVLRVEQDSEVQFYLANAYFESKKIKEAIVHFEELIVNQNRYKTRSMWYLVLCQLELKNIAEAKRLAINLSKEQDSYSIKAKQLLAKLDKGVANMNINVFGN